MRKLLFLVSYVSVFLLGFFGRVYLAKFGIGVEKVDQKILNQSQESVSGNDQFVTYVEYNLGNFSSEYIKVHKGDYLAITNIDKDSLMWLSATMSAWNTVRGYGEGERLMMTLEDVGLYKIAEKMSGSELTVEVYQ